MAWTAAEDQQLREFSKGDLHYTEVATLMNRKPSAIRWRARKLGLNASPGKAKVGKWKQKA